MNFLQNIADKWSEFQEKLQPTKEKMGESLSSAKKATQSTWKFIYRLRKVFLAVPVAWIAIQLALTNLADLPAVVGIVLQTDGEFSMLLARELAVLGPLAITALCLLLMFISRRLLTPWFVSLISLLLPVLIRILNTFPS